MKSRLGSAAASQPWPPVRDRGVARGSVRPSPAGRRFRGHVAVGEAAASGPLVAARLLCHARSMLCTATTRTRSRWVDGRQCDCRGWSRWRRGGRVSPLFAGPLPPLVRSRVLRVDVRGPAVRRSGDSAHMVRVIHDGVDPARVASGDRNRGRQRSGSCTRRTAPAERGQSRGLQGTSPSD